MKVKDRQYSNFKDPVFNNWLLGVDAAATRSTMVQKNNSGEVMQAALEKNAAWPMGLLKTHFTGDGDIVERMSNRLTQDVALEASGARYAFSIYETLMYDKNRGEDMYSKFQNPVYTDILSKK